MLVWAGFLEAVFFQAHSVQARVIMTEHLHAAALSLHSPAELAAVVRASTHHEFSRLGAANRAFAAACGPVLGELWSAEMILQFAGAYDDCVSGRVATAGPSYRC